MESRRFWWNSDSVADIIAVRSTLNWVENLLRTTAQPLSQYYVGQSWLFHCTGVDYRGHLYKKRSGVMKQQNVWLCLYPCCNTKVVHLDQVLAFSNTTFIASSSTPHPDRGMSSTMTSDKSKNLKLASGIIRIPLTVQKKERIQLSSRLNENSHWRRLLCVVNSV